MRTPFCCREALDRPQWLQAPQYDAKQHLLSWSNTQPGPLPARTVILRFGRTWTADMRAAGGTGTDALLDKGRAIAAGLHFNPGEDYADAKPDDNRATNSLADVISGDPNPMQQMAAEGLAASLQQDQEQRDSEVGRLLLRLAGPVLGLLALGIGAANRKKAAAQDGDGAHADSAQPSESPAAPPAEREHG